MKQEDLYQALSRLVDRDISPELFAELEAYLLSSEQAKRQYQEYMHLYSLTNLEIDLQGRGDIVVPVDRILRKQKRRSVTIALSAAAAVIVMGIAMMQFFLVDHGDTLAFDTSPGSRFSLTYGQDGEELHTGDVMRVGANLRLTQGCVELQFASGVSAFVLAPANLTLVAEDQLQMKEGRAWFQVPEQAIGFKVQTDNLDVTDLGTEFGVLAMAGGRDEVHVFKGQVEAQTKRIRHSKEILHAGEARQVDSVGRLMKLDVKPSKFLTQLPVELPHLHWSFDEPDGFQVQGNHPVAAEVTSSVSNSPTLSSGVLGGGLVLNGEVQYLETDWQGFGGARPRTVAFWLKLPTDGQVDVFAGIVGWGDNSQEHAKWSVVTRQKLSNKLGRLSLFWGNDSIHTDFIIAGGSWHHFVVSDSGLINQDDQAVQIYMDGQKLDLSGNINSRFAINTLTYSEESIPVTIGSTIRHREVANRRRFLRGEIDELYIFDGAMTDAQIRQFATTQLSLAGK